MLIFAFVLSKEFEEIEEEEDGVGERIGRLEEEDKKEEGF